MKNRPSRLPLTFFVCSIFLILQGCGAPKINSASSKTVDHTPWNKLLQKHVDEYGLVDYKNFKADSSALKEYLRTISTTPPNTTEWSKEEQMAYWINAYNAFTVDIIIRHYPTSSIKDIKSGVPFINTVWDIKFIKIGGEELDLNNIEHGILRKNFADPRIHFALVCASMSCPKLQTTAFTADALDEQLDKAGQDFFNEAFRNEISDNSLKLSKLLSWYWGDFKDKYETRHQLLDEYHSTAVNKSLEIEYLDYNWQLNEQSPENIRLMQGL